MISWQLLLHGVLFLGKIGAAFKSACTKPTKDWNVDMLFESNVNKCVCWNTKLLAAYC